MTRINCPHCNQAYDLTPEQVPAYSGQTITCTQCNRSFTVPNLTGPASAQAPTPVQPIGYANLGYAPAQRTNGMAIGALICGLLALVLPLLGIVAIVLGILALKKTRDPAVGGKGMAIAGISVGAVGIVLAGCMISILLPSLNRARETASRVQCASNMRQIGQAILLYQFENDGASPPDLKTAFLTQDIGTIVACCLSTATTPAPSAQTFDPKVHSDYIYVGAGTTGRTLTADHILLYEPISNHDGDGANFLFGDGHVEFLNRPTAQAYITQLESGQNPPR